LTLGSVVVDSSVIVAALVDAGDDGSWAEETLENGPLYAPELIRAEVANVLLRLERAQPKCRFITPGGKD